MTTLVRGLVLCLAMCALATTISTDVAAQTCTQNCSTVDCDWSATSCGVGGWQQCGCWIEWEVFFNASPCTTCAEGRAYYIFDPRASPPCPWQCQYTTFVRHCMTCET